MDSEGAVDWPDIPMDVIDYVRSVFGEANRRTTERLLNMPNIREAALDDGLVESIIPRSAPCRLGSGSVVRMEVHNVGGGRHFRRWEVADIAVLVCVFRSGRPIAQKIGVLQAKRLYPKNGEVEVEDAIDYMYGMNRFIQTDPTMRLNPLESIFEFDDECTYAQLKAGTKQVKVIEEFNQVRGEVAHYLFYNPPTVPSTVEYPVESYREVEEVTLGCRVYSAKDVREVLSGLREGVAPTLGAMEAAKPSSNWVVEHWAANLLLSCSVGVRLVDGEEGQQLRSMLTRRTGPIGAAIQVSIILPGG